MIARRVSTTEARAPQGLAYIPALDGVRGLAVLMVMVCHQTVMIPSGPGEKLFLDIMRTGWVGVDLFFVLSGFLITSILLNEVGSPRYYRNFYIRRFLRIVPLYYAVLIVFLWIVPAFTMTALGEDFGDSHWWFWTFLSNILISIKGRWSYTAVTPSWSLAIEEQFYLVWPLVVALTTPSQLKKVCLYLMGAAWIFRVVFHFSGVNPFAIYVLPITRMDTLVIGALIAVHAAQGTVVRLWSGLGPLLFATGMCVSAWPGRESGLMAVFGFSLVALGAGAIVSEVALSKRTGKTFLEAEAIRFIGRHSYAIYLFHVPVAGAFIVLGYSPGALAQKTGSIVAAQLFFYLFSSFTTTLAAYLAYHGLEKHFLRLKPQRFAADS